MRTAILCATICITNLAFGQDKKFSADSLKEDLVYMKNQLFNVHANPFTEWDKTRYEKYFQSIEKELKDSMTITEFYARVKPAVSKLSDEHADVTLPEQLRNYNSHRLYLPISLVQKGNDYVVDTLLADVPGLKKGDKITKVGDLTTAAAINRLADYTTGFPDQRLRTAARQFGNLAALALPPAASIDLVVNGKKLTVQRADASLWADHFGRLWRAMTSYKESISYEKFGETGYIYSPTFDSRSRQEYQRFEEQIDSIFTLLQKDGVKRLVIDVSNNPGGNSAIGNMMIDRFTNRPYLAYQMNWRRSNEYLALLKSWGLQDSVYEAMKPGAVIHSDPDTLRPYPHSNRFKGKVYVLVGNNTFSSAIMFATLIKDNSLATIIGTTPVDGHPTHFGEMYYTELPHTKLGLRFGVKEWIRPIGFKGENVLKPDVETKLKDHAAVADFVAKLP